MKKLMLLSIPVMLTACATQPPKNYVISEEKIVLEPTKQEVSLVFERDYHDDKEVSEKFRVVKASHTAKLTGLKILQGITGQRVTGFNKFELLGDVIHIENVPQNYTLATVREGIKKHVKLDKETKWKRLELTPMNWRLVYDELVGNDNYTLYYDFKLSYSYQENKGNGEKVMGDKILTCKEKVEGRTFEEWEKDNYAMVIPETKKMSDKCLSELNSFLSSFK